MANHTCERGATVTLDDEEYDVWYEISGTCTYQPGKTWGPPEDCYPDESESEVDTVKILQVDGEEDFSDYIRDRILLELDKLDLSSFLYESWQLSGGPSRRDDEPDCDEG